MTVSIRPAKTSDRELIQTLARPEKESLGYLGDSACHHYLQLGACLMAAVDGQVIGYLIGVSSYSTRPALAGVLQLCVDRDCRRRGVAAELMRQFRLDCESLNVMAIQAWCRADLGANDFFLQADFHPKAEANGGVKRGQKLICWWLPLDSQAASCSWAQPTNHRPGGKFMPTLRELATLPKYRK